MAPVVGIPADLANAGISYTRGDYIGAGLSVSAAVPVAGTFTGLAKLARKAKKVLGKAFSKAPAPRGLKAADGTKVTGYTRHGANRAVGDWGKRAGTKPQATLDALKNPRSVTDETDSLGRPSRVFMGNDARVIVNPKTGKVVSVNPLSGKGAK